MKLQNIIYTVMDGLCKRGPGAFSSVLHQRLAAEAGWRKNKDGWVYSWSELVFVFLVVFGAMVVLFAFSSVFYQRLAGRRIDLEKNKDGRVHYL